MAKKVFVGVGHGGADPGAVANGFKEKDLNLPIALACRDELQRHGVSVLMSRTKDEDETLSGKIKMANDFGADLALDIHNNAGGGDGAEVYHTYLGGKGKTLAKNILAEIVKLGQYNRGAKVLKNSRGVDGYLFIRNTTMPAVIVECAFLDNKNDITIIDTPAEQKAMGIAIAKGVLQTLGIAYIEPAAAPAATTSKLYRVQVGAYKVKTNATNMQKKLKAAGFDAIIVEVDAPAKG